MRFHGIMSEAMNLGSLINGISSFLHVTAVHAESKEVALSGWSKGDEGKSLWQNGRVLCEPGGCAREGGGGGATNLPTRSRQTSIPMWSCKVEAVNLIISPKIGVDVLNAMKKKGIRSVFAEMSSILFVCFFLFLKWLFIAGFAMNVQLLGGFKP